jgi:hypothetical protein
MSDLSPLSGVKRKLDFGAVRSAFDPVRTFQPSSDLKYLAACLKITPSAFSEPRTFANASPYAKPPWSRVLE